MFHLPNKLVYTGSSFLPLLGCLKSHVGTPRDDIFAQADQELAKIEERLDYLAEFLLLPQRFMEAWTPHPSHGT